MAIDDTPKDMAAEQRTDAARAKLAAAQAVLRSQKRLPEQPAGAAAGKGRLPSSAAVPPNAAPPPLPATPPGVGDVRLERMRKLREGAEGQAAFHREQKELTADPVARREHQEAIDKAEELARQWSATEAAHVRRTLPTAAHAPTLQPAPRLPEQPPAKASAAPSPVAHAPAAAATAPPLPGQRDARAGRAPRLPEALPVAAQAPRLPEAMPTAAFAPPALPERPPAAAQKPRQFPSFTDILFGYGPEQKGRRGRYPTLGEAFYGFDSNDDTQKDRAGGGGKSRFRFPESWSDLGDAAFGRNGAGGGSGDDKLTDAIEDLNDNIQKMTAAVDKLTQAIDHQQSSGRDRDAGAERWGPGSGPAQQGSRRGRSGGTPPGGAAGSGNAMISRMLGQAIARAGAAGPGGAAAAAGAAPAAAAPAATGAAAAAASAAPVIL